MSFCRFSIRREGVCDVYAYEAAEGFVTHVRGDGRLVTHVDPDLASFKARLLALRADGYRFPDYVLETVDGEIADEAKEMTV